jgi:hypothetical protein
VKIGAEPYRPDQAAEWNAFVARSRNGTFLFDRGYMDYHADRFPDASLLFRDERGRLIALMPASRKDDVLISHGGLTYGGVVSGPEVRVAGMLHLFDALLDHARKAKVRRIVYKPVPHIYHVQPAEEDLYALFRNGALLIRMDASATIDLRNPLGWSHGRKSALGKARKAGLTVRETHDFHTYMGIVEDRLRERHDTAPTHTAEEIGLLARRFPDRIRLFAAYAGEHMLAGIVIYDCGRCAHAQYIAATSEGTEYGAVEVIVDRLLTEIYANRDWFDFGISTEQAGRHLNEGLSGYKEMFGARTTVYTAWEIPVD